MAEFAHHAGFRRLIEGGTLSFVSEGADLAAIADQVVLAAKAGGRSGPAVEWNAWWRATTAASRAAMLQG
jgi:hypothetical protein